MRIAYGARSEIGRVRSANEDAYLIQAPLFAVADGLGGHIAGEVASSTAMQVIAEHAGGEVTHDHLADLVREANAAVWGRSVENPALSGMGTTCTLVLIDDATVHIAHVGDSRAYLLRDGALEQLTQDHTLVARLVREGRLRPEEAHRHPQRSVITRALGIEEDVEIDLDSRLLEINDRLLLCSDGLTSMIDDNGILRALQQRTEAQPAADLLVELANEAGGEDNITVIVLDVTHDGEVAGETAATPAGDAVARAEGAPDPPASGTPKWVKRTGIVLASLLVAGGAAYAAGNYALNNLLWYVGVNDAGRVTIFHGVPDPVGGIDLSSPEEETDLVAADLPEFVRTDVLEGHKVSSLVEAREYIANLEQRVLDFSPSPQPSRR